MDKSTLYKNISVCLGYADYEGVKKWIRRAYSAIDIVEFLELCGSVVADLRKTQSKSVASKYCALAIIDLLWRLYPGTNTSRQRHGNEDRNAEFRLDEGQMLIEQQIATEQSSKQVKQKEEEPEREKDLQAGIGFKLNTMWEVVEKQPHKQGSETHSPILGMDSRRCSLYHFTDARNVPSIQRHGLLSWPLLVGRGIQHFPASNKLSRELDAHKDLQNYVRLCLKPQHPMATRALYEGRVQSLVWLEINNVVTRWRTTRFSNRNATSNGAIVDSNPSTAFSSEDQQAEVLIKDSLNSRWIRFP